MKGEYGGWFLLFSLLVIGTGLFLSAPTKPEWVLTVATKGALDLLVREEYHTEKGCKRESTKYYRGSLEVNCRKL